MPRFPILKNIISLLAIFAAILGGGASMAFAGTSLGLSVDLVSENRTPGSFPLVQGKSAAPIFVDAGDYPGVRRAAAELREDVGRVTGLKPNLEIGPAPAGRSVIVIGAIGKSPLIDGLIQSGKINVQEIAGKWESFLIVTVPAPWPGVDRALVIAGSDQRGTIYGIYELSEQMGVSPWYWWADVTPQHRDALFVKQGSYRTGPPAVKYRGIFINDEDPCLSGWAKKKFGGVNSKMYAHVFELLLRLRANYLWPAMWGKAFNEDDPESPKLAAEYGIVMGTSHHEPMMRAQAEWTHNGHSYGNGEWNYQTNAEGLRKFWTDGVTRNGNYENIYTLGMRGDGDLPMPDAGGLEANKKLLETIIADQRKILAHHVNPDLSRVPQLWALFTEVQKYYDAGLRLPDDVTLLFTDDNVGNLRRVPDPEEARRSGGAGIYYHMDMHGGPFSYQWLNTSPLPKVWEQMNLAYRYGADRIWIVNVGDIKPLEIPIEFFMRFAWNPDAITKDGVAEYQRRWAEREFGVRDAAKIAGLVAEYAKYNAWRKPELVKPATFSQLNYDEADRVARAWSDLESRAEKIYAGIPANRRDAYYELVLHPIKACATVALMNIDSARNQLYAQEGRTSANLAAEQTRSLFDTDQRLTDYYNHTLAAGKWDHMMDQVHLGYVDWFPPLANSMPPVSRVLPARTADYGVSIQGSGIGWPNYNQAELPAFDSLLPQRSWIDVFQLGVLPFHVSYKADQPWIRLATGKPPIAAASDIRLWVEIDWTKAPVGESVGTVTIRGAQAPIVVHVRAVKASPEQQQEAQGAFGGMVGPIAIDAQDFSANIAVDGVRWEAIPDYGRGRSAMSIFPVTAKSFPPSSPAPRLEYPLFLARPGAYSVDLITNPTLDLYPGRGLSAALSIDDQPLQTVDVFAGQGKQDETFLGRHFYQNTSTGVRVMHFNLRVDTPGRHTLKIAMIDPTLVIEKIVVHSDPLPNSYFGPPVKADQPDEAGIERSAEHP
jgi:hypothetical protein